MSRKWMIDAMKGLSDVEPQLVQLMPGDDEGAWSEIKNMRLETDGYNVFWKPRGGAQHVYAFPANIVTTFCFQTRIAGVLKTYIAAHCSNGTVYLYDVDTNSKVTVDTGFASTTPIQMHNIGIFLYLFSASDGKRRVYNISAASASNWNSIQAKPITAYSWVTGGDFRIENIWGFRNDEPVLKLSNFYTEGSNIATATGGVLAPNTAYRFTFPASHKTLIIDGVEYDNTQIYVNGGTPKGFTYGSGSNNPTVTPLIGVPVIDGKIQMSVFRTRIEKIYEDGTVATDKTQFGLSQMSQVDEDFPIFPDTPDLASYIGANSLYRYLNADITYNPDYADPIMYRAYAVIDLAFDGSVSLIGRPIVVSSGVGQIMSGSTLSRRGVTLTLPASDNGGTLKRVLVATRWQSSEDAALTPTSENYPNSPFFIVKDVDATATSVTDFTPDRLLIRPISEFLPITAGIPLVYSRDSIAPSTTAAFKGSLILGGYTVSRQVPRPYTDSSNSANGNVYIENDGAASDLAHKASFVFEYNDGSYSQVVDSGVAFKEAAVVAGSPASVSFEVDSAASGTGTARIQFDIYPSIPFSVTTGDAVGVIASAIVAALTANTLFNTDWQASAVGGIVTIECRTDGAAYNGRDLSIDTSSLFTVDSEFGVTDGGADPDTTYKTSVSFHNMNAEISSVFLLAKADSGGAYRLVGQYPVQDPRANGKPVTTPGSNTDIVALPSYTVTSASRTLETVYLQNFVATCVPPQNPRFDAQAPLVTNGEIMSVIPISYDSDRASVLRYRLVVLTDQDVQVGYLVEQATATGIIYEANLEVIDSDTQALRRYGSTRILDTVYFQSNQGLSAVVGAQVKLVVERERYPILASGIIESMAYQKRHGELWVQFDASATLLVVDIKSGRVRQDVYASNVTSLGWSDTSMIACIGPHIMAADDETTAVDNPETKTATVDSNAWTFGTLSDPFLIGDGTTTISITDIVAGVDTAAQIAGNIVTKVNDEPGFKARAYAEGATITFVPIATCTLTFSAEPEFTPSASPFTLTATAFSMTALTQAIQSQVDQVKILELSVMGQGVSCVPAFDFQRPRLESVAGAWSKTFTAELTESSKSLTMAGASWQIHRRGIKPRILLTFTPSAGGFIETVRVKTETTQNIGKPRQ